MCDEVGVGDVTIGTHYFDLRQISNEQDGDRGEGEMPGTQEEVLQVGVEKLAHGTLCCYYDQSRVFANFWTRLDQPVRFCPELLYGRRHSGA